MGACAHYFPAGVDERGLRQLPAVGGNWQLLQADKKLIALYAAR